MAESVMRHVATGAICGVLWCASSFLSLAHAQVLVDPTRPPNAATAGQEEAANTGPVVQSILIGAGRREAIINGRTVTVGDRFGDAQVVSISDAEVVLRNGNELQRLKLFPAIEKRMGANRGDAKTGLRGQEK